MVAIIGQSVILLLVAKFTLNLLRESPAYPQPHGAPRGADGFPSAFEIQPYLQIVVFYWIHSGYFMVPGT
jgi:hypothetical protein